MYQSTGDAGPIDGQFDDSYNNSRDAQETSRLGSTRTTAVGQTTTTTMIPATSGLSLSHREQDLRQLLAEERQRSEQRKANYKALKDEHIKLQKDFLSLQSETKSILEETKSLKDRKEAELRTITASIEDKDMLIESLRKELKQRDPEVVKQQFAGQLKEPLKRLEKEKEMLLREKDRLAGDLKLAKQKIEYLEKEIVDSIERVRLGYEAEINLVKKEKEELKVKFMEATKTPEGQKILALTQENERLLNWLEAKERALQESQKLERKVESELERLVSGQVKAEAEHEEQVGTLRLQLNAQREENHRLDEISKHLRREKTNLIREIERLERDHKRHQEEKALMEKSWDQEKERLRRTFTKEKMDLEIERNCLLDEIKRLKVDLEVKTEAMKQLEKAIETRERDYQNQLENLRQQEINERSAWERERASLELRIAELSEERSRLKQELDGLKRQLESSNEVRLSLEKETMILKAKVENFQVHQEELDQLRRSYTLLKEESRKLRDELADLSAVNKDLTFQRERFKEEYNRVKIELEDERRELTEYKIESEKNLVRLRTCLEEERSEMKIKFDHLQDEYRRKHKEREEMKAKCKQYANLVDKLQSKVKSLEDKVTTMEKTGEETVPLKVHKELKRQYKELKRNLNRDTVTPAPSVVSPHHCKLSHPRS